MDPELAWPDVPEELLLPVEPLELPDVDTPPDPVLDPDAEPPAAPELPERMTADPLPESVLDPLAPEFDPLEPKPVPDPLEPVPESPPELELPDSPHANAKMEPRVRAPIEMRCLFMSNLLLHGASPGDTR